MTQVPQVVTACALIIGNEILSGRTPDANLNHLARTLGEWGIQMREARVIPDLEAEIITALNACRHRYNYVFTTGGIGPTHDDITAACVAKAFDAPLVANPTIAALIGRRQAPPEVMEMRLRMALIPQGAELVGNPTGGPQGFRIDNVIVMAGIPRVMQAMLSTLEGKLERGPVMQSRTVTAYLGESEIARGLSEVQARYPDIDLGSYPFFRDNRYGAALVMRGASSERLEQMLAEVCQVIEDAGEQPQHEA